MLCFYKFQFSINWYFEVLRQVERTWAHHRNYFQIRYYYPPQKKPLFWGIVELGLRVSPSVHPSVCLSRTISHKPFNILFWNITHLFVTSVPCFQPSFGKLKFKIPDLEHFLRKKFEKSCVQEALPKFSIFFKSVSYLLAMFSPKFLDNSNSKWLT